MDGQQPRMGDSGRRGLIPLTQTKKSNSRSGLLLQYIHFPSLSLSALRAIDEYAQSMGPSGVDLQREVCEGIRVSERSAARGLIRPDTQKHEGGLERN